MRIITNPGSNLTQAIVSRYDVDVTPQQIVVDGVLHDTRDGIPHATVDGWVRTAKEHPHVLGTSAAEFVDIFRSSAQKDRELVAIMTSRKIIGSYTAAVAATKVLKSVPDLKDVRVAVVDTMTTDLGTCLCTVLAGEAIRAGLTLEKVATTVERFAAGGTFALTLGTLDNLVKGGRASFLRAWIANALNLTPIVTFEDGELVAAGKVSRSKDVIGAMVDFIGRRIAPKRAVWVGVSHGGVPVEAAQLAKELASKYVVMHEEVREVQSSIYLHVGRGALGAWVYPIDDVGFSPQPPFHF